MSNVRRLENPSEAGAGPMPDKPGPWWVLLDRNTDPEIVGVLRGLRVEIAGWDTHLSHLDPRLRWLAPVPGPATCAALVECWSAEQAWANGGLDDERLERALADAESRLHAALRSERGGAA